MISLADLKKAVDKAVKDNQNPETIEVEMRLAMGNQPEIAFMQHTGTPKFIVRVKQ